MPKRKDRDFDAEWSFLDESVFELDSEGALHHFCHPFRDALSEQE
jgi:hypothetical protein